jgi:hypothetical protein
MALRQVKDDSLTIDDFTRNGGSVDFKTGC